MNLDRHRLREIMIVTNASIRWISSLLCTYVEVDTEDLFSLYFNRFLISFVPTSVL